MTPVNLDRIQEAIDAGTIDPNLPITMKTLKDANVINKVEDGVKLLARVFLHLCAILIINRERRCSLNPLRYMYLEHLGKQSKQLKAMVER
jgi:large subunit ribosomal protein L15